MNNFFNEVYDFMETGILMLFLVFILNVVSNCLGTLKTIFISKQIGNITYIITAIDALFFSIVLKAISDGDGILFIFAYCLGKVVGAILADILENKYIALGIYEVTIYSNPTKAIEIADKLRLLGYSVNTCKQYGNNGKERYAIIITIERKELDFLREKLSEFDLNNPTMIVQEIKSIEGKIKAKANK